jgi:hypothetical protein
LIQTFDPSRDLIQSEKRGSPRSKDESIFLVEAAAQSHRRDKI